MWESVKPYWNAINDFLSIPFVQFFGPIVLVGFTFAFRPVRQWSMTLWLWAWRKVKDGFLVPKLFPALGIATSRDLAELRDSIRGQQGSSWNERPKLNGQTLERLNLKFTLGNYIQDNLVKRQPNDVSSDIIDSILQGPFCPNCSRNLLFIEYSKHAPPKRMMRLKCPGPECTWSWPYSKTPQAESLPADQIKREVYESLDAEMRQTGNLKETV